MMKFSVDERVKQVSTQRTGTVISTEYRVTNIAGKVDTIRKYQVLLDGDAFSRTFLEQELDSTTNISEESLININKLLIDLHLQKGDYDMVKYLAEEIYGKEEGK